MPHCLAWTADHRWSPLQGLLQCLVSIRTANALQALDKDLGGHLMSVEDLVLYGRCWWDDDVVQLHFLQFFSPLRGSQELWIPLSEEVKCLFFAWAPPSQILWGKSFVQTVPELTLVMDTSCQSWGAVCLSHHLLELWSKQEFRKHINLLQFRTVVPGRSHTYGKKFYQTRALWTKALILSVITFVQPR